VTALKLASQLIRSFEKCRLYPYQNTINGKLDKPTIGWGNTEYEDGRAVTLKDPPLTQDQADSLSDFFVAKFMDAVLLLVKVPITDNQIAALTSFEYNTGHLAGSELLTKLNAGDYKGAAEHFVDWDHVNHTVNQELFFRRNKEKDLFLEGVA